MNLSMQQYNEIETKLIQAIAVLQIMQEITDTTVDLTNAIWAAEGLVKDAHELFERARGG